MGELIVEKQFLNEQSVILDSFKLGAAIYSSGFRPTFIVGLWRGGSTIGIYVQECLQTLGVETDHIALRTSYQGLSHYQETLDVPDPKIRVHGTQYLLETLNAEDRLLIVDDVLSTGRNVTAVISRLKSHLKRNMPNEVKVAALWHRPSHDKTGLQPDFSLYVTQNWLVFPYELNGLTVEEIQLHKPFVTVGRQVI